MGSTDSIPVVSQVKSMVQLAAGDVDGAIQTQANFRDTAPIVSQVTSTLHRIGGNEQKAIEVEKKFLKSVDEITDALPVVGHIKGGIYYATGDTERGDQTMKDATGSLVSIGAGAAGFAVGGPAGAAAASIAASHAYDGIITGIDTAIQGTNITVRYYGSLNTYDRIGKGEADAGEIFDVVGMTAIEAGAGAIGGAKLRLGKGGKLGRIRCKRDVEYHLTSDEAQFVTSHQRLPGSASEVLTANWQHMSAPQTVSNLVSLFVILRLILWNDNNGRTYSRELCSMTADYDYIEKCQESLMKTLRQMDDHIAKQEEDSDYVYNPDVIMTGITDNSSIIMIQSMASLYGILDSIARGDSMGITWLIELCVYEDMATHGICEEEVLHKLKKLGKDAFSLGKARKIRVKRARPCGLRNAISNSNDNVGRHSSVQAANRIKNANKAKVKYESNHVPARSATPGKPAGSLPAHSLPYDTHQIAMSKVGTSKSSHVAKLLQKYEKDLVDKGRMAEAIKLDLSQSYGRANTKLNVKGGTTTDYKPALVEYSNDMKAVVKQHLDNGNISQVEANGLVDYIDGEVNNWNSSRMEGRQKWEEWMDRRKDQYTQILEENNLNSDPKMHVSKDNIHYG